MPCSSLKRKRWHEPTSSAPESFFQNYPSYSVRRASSLNAADDGVTFVRPDAKGMLQSSKSTRRRRHCATLSFEDKWTVPLCPKTLSQPKQLHTWLGYLRAMTLSLSKYLNEMKRLRMGVDPCLKQPTEVLLLKSTMRTYLCRELCRCVGELPSFKVVQVTSISVPIESNSSPWLLRLQHSSSSSHSIHAKELWMGASDASDSDPSSLGSVSQSSQVTSSWVLLDSAILFKGTRAATDLTADHDANMIQFLFDLAACFTHGKNISRYSSISNFHHLQSEKLKFHASPESLPPPMHTSTAINLCHDSTPAKAQMKWTLIPVYYFNILLPQTPTVYLFVVFCASEDFSKSFNSFSGNSGDICRSALGAVGADSFDAADLEVWLDPVEAPAEQKLVIKMLLHHIIFNDFQHLAPFSVSIASFT